MAQNLCGAGGRLVPGGQSSRIWDSAPSSAATGGGGRVGEQNAAVLRLSNPRSPAEVVAWPLNCHVNAGGSSISDVRAEQHMAQRMQMHCHLKHKAEGALVNISEQHRGQKYRRGKKKRWQQIKS